MHALMFANSANDHVKTIHAHITHIRTRFNWFMIKISHCLRQLLVMCW